MIFSDFCYFEIKPEMRDVLAKMQECGKQAKMRDFPHNCGTVDTYVFSIVSVMRLTSWVNLGCLTLFCSICTNEYCLDVNNSVTNEEKQGSCCIGSIG